MKKNTRYLRKATAVGYIALALLIVSALFYFSSSSVDPVKIKVIYFISLPGLIPLATVLVCLPLMVRFGGYKLSVVLLFFVGFWLLINGYDLPDDGGLSAVTTLPASLLYIIVGLVMFSSGFNESRKTK